MSKRNLLSILNDLSKYHLADEERLVVLTYLNNPELLDNALNKATLEAYINKYWKDFT